MMLIVIYLVVEIWPIWHVLNGDFIDFFIEPEYLLRSKDIVEGLLRSERHMSLARGSANAINFDAGDLSSESERPVAFQSVLYSNQPEPHSMVASDLYALPDPEQEDL